MLSNDSDNQKKQPVRMSLLHDVIFAQIEESAFYKQMISIFNIGALLVGTVVVGMILVGGIQYIAAGDNAQAIQEAKNRIKNAVIGLVLFILMYSVIDFLVPGGLFS